MSNSKSKLEKVAIIAELPLDGPNPPVILDINHELSSTDQPTKFHHTRAVNG